MTFTIVLFGKLLGVGICLPLCRKGIKMNNELAGPIFTIISIVIIFFVLYMQGVREKLTKELNTRKKQITEINYRMLLLSRPPIHPKTLEYLNIRTCDEKFSPKIDSIIVNQQGMDVLGNQWYFVAAGEVPTFILVYAQSKFPAIAETIHCRIPLSELGNDINYTLSTTCLECPEAYEYLIKTIGTNLLAAYACKHTDAQWAVLHELGTRK